MAIDPRISLAVDVRDIGPAINTFNNILNSRQNREIAQAAELRRQERAPFENRLLQARTDSAEIQSQQLRNRARFESVNQAALELRGPLDRALKTRDTTEVNRILDNRLQDLQARQDAGETVDMRETLQAKRLIQSGDIEGLSNSVNDIINVGQRLGIGVQPKSAGQREFENLISGFTPEERAKAKRVKARIEAPAVGSAAQTIADQGTGAKIGDSQALIKEREEFAKKTGASRSKAIDTGFENISRIDRGLSNIDRAIRLIRAGAGTGAIEQFLPSFKASSVALDQLQGELSLDVLGGVSLGSISDAELDLASLVALPKGLDGPPLIAHLQERKAAQEKVKNYLLEQVEFLDQGGTVAGFLRMKQRETGINPSLPAQPVPQRPSSVGRFQIEVVN